MFKIKLNEQTWIFYSQLGLAHLQLYFFYSYNSMNQYFLHMRNPYFNSKEMAIGSLYFYSLLIWLLWGLESIFLLYTRSLCSFINHHCFVKSRALFQDFNWNLIIKSWRYVISLQNTHTCCENIKISCIIITIPSIWFEEKLIYILFNLNWQSIKYY